jgi:glycosyltransferase involved in cell wall biosynthesis
MSKPTPLQSSGPSGGRGLLGTSVSVVVPTLNEAQNIGWTLERIPKWVSEVLLVDGLSSDGTVEIARQHRPDIVLVEERTRGKGAALRAGFAAASSDIIVMIDADGSTNPKEMIRFVYALLAGADFVKGSREARGGGSVDITRVRGLGNRFFVGLVNLLHNGGFTDLCYGYCAFWKRHLPALALSATGFEIETELVLNAARAGLEIVEVPSLELERRAGTSNLSAWRDGLRVLRTIFTRHLGIGASAASAPAAQGAAALSAVEPLGAGPQADRNPSLAHQAALP